MSVSLTREDAVRIAVADAEHRSSAAAAVSSVEEDTFGSSALDAPRPGEMSASVMTPGWRILVNAGDRSYVYRASARQVRLVGDEGPVQLIHPK